MTSVKGPEHRPRRRAVTPDEARVWRAVTRDVAPLPGKAVEDEAEEVSAAPDPAPSPPPQPIPADWLERLRPAPPRPLAKPDLVAGAPVGLDKRTGERLKKGEMEIDGRLDLHGMTQDAAHGALLSFITRAYDSGRRCLLVITGKGGRPGPGVLKTQVPRWLNQAPLRERIIGFSWAQPKHGGEGALYVLIKRRRG